MSAPLTVWDTVLMVVYLASLVGLFSYGVNCYVLMMLHRRHREAWTAQARATTEAFWSRDSAEGRLPR